MTHSDHPLQRDSMAERVKQQLLRRIMSGELPPGTRLVELQIARDLNTSQGPVREALRELEAIDLVTTEPYKGSRVRDVTPQDIREAYMVRTSLEELAGQLAARFLKGKVDPLRKEAEAIRKAAAQKNIEQYAKHDHNFHRMIVEASQNRILLRSWNSLAFEARIQMRITKGNLNLSQVQEAHWDIIKALDEGNGTQAGRLLRKHIDCLPDSDLNERKSTP
jgi:DNA-binding GntR family transcriptional regulator